MAHRIEPFRDYSEHEVVNLFALNISALKISDDGDNVRQTPVVVADMKNLSAGQWDSGVVVAIDAGVLPQEVPGTWAGSSDADLRAYLGHAHTDAHIGFNDMPKNKMTVSPAITDAAFGITLRQTLAYDENGENLLRYPVKKDELQAVGPGETVPVLTRGLVLLDGGAIQGALGVGEEVEVNDDVTDGVAGTCVSHGKLKLLASGKSVGRCLAKDATLGKYLMKLSF